MGVGKGVWQRGGGRRLCKPVRTASWSTITLYTYKSALWLAQCYDENVHIYTTDMYERQGMLLAQAAYTTRRYVMYPRFLTPQLYTSTFMYCSKREA